MSGDDSAQGQSVTPAFSHACASARPGGSTDVADLARRTGFAIEWQDALGQPQTVSDATLATLLDCLGLPCDDETALRKSLATLDAESPQHRLPPLLTAVAGQPIVLPAGQLQAGMRYALYFEGEAGESSIDGVLARPSANTGMPAKDGPAQTHSGADACLVIPGVTRIGYHTLRVGPLETRIAVAPRRCFSVQDVISEASDAGVGKDASAGARGPNHGGMWGACVQVYSVRRDGDGGLGDVAGLRALAQSLARCGADALAISPMHAMFSANPGKFSPYSPSSRLFLNVLHIDPSAVFGEAAAARAITECKLEASLHEWESQPLIDWHRVACAKLAILRTLFDHARRNHDPRLNECEAFRQAGGASLERHAQFEALHEWLAKRADKANNANNANNSGKTDKTDDEANATAVPVPLSDDWRRWPEALRDPSSEAVEAFAATHRDAVDFHIFLQWQADRGLALVQEAARDAGMAIGVIADLAVGCDGAGSQTWSEPASMLHGVSVGAPPDLLNRAGQSWGLTTFSPRALTTQGFSAFIEMVRGAFAHAGGIRVDHILGLRRLWLVPEGRSAAEGAFLQYPMEDLLRLLALESWRHRAIVIGEDLGTVPPGLREALAESALLGMRVLWFERGESSANQAASAPAAARPGFTAPRDFSPDAIAMTTTHDLPTIAGWWAGDDILWRDRIGQSHHDAAGLLQEQDERRQDRAVLWQALVEAGVVASVDPLPDTAPVDAVLRFIALSAAPLVLFPMEDLLGLSEQPNLPGSMDEHPNWRRRLPLSLTRLFPVWSLPGNTTDALNSPYSHRGKRFCDRLNLIDSTRHPYRP